MPARDNFASKKSQPLDRDLKLPPINHYTTRAKDALDEFESVKTMIRSGGDRSQYFRIHKPLNAKFHQSPTQPSRNKPQQLHNHNSMPYLIVPQDPDPHNHYHQKVEVCNCDNKIKEQAQTVHYLEEQCKKHQKLINKLILKQREDNLMKKFNE